ncbi:MAG TPA: hypothetical protein VFB15_11295 [Candidatus Binataceae bacterium]|jgi:hypothetical protein|nr:hypothetical protein [Candidatus Binataceae bacterium]
MKPQLEELRQLLERPLTIANLRAIAEATEALAAALSTLPSCGREELRELDELVAALSRRLQTFDRLLREQTRGLAR